MTKILFVIHDLDHGGAEKVLVNLVNNMDKSRYDVSVLALFDGGVNRQFLNDDVKYKYCFKRMIKGNSHIMKIFSPRFLYKHLIKDNYDIVVSFLEGPSARIVSGADKNTKKICWIHCTMSSKYQIGKSFRSYKESVKCYQTFEKIVFVSSGVKSAFLRFIPTVNVGEILYNTNETDKILKDSRVPLPEKESRLFNKSGLKFCYVGKLITGKGIWRLANIHVRLVKEGYNITTYVIGKGEEEDNIKKYIIQNGCQDTFLFLGYQTNPYKYMSRCDWFVCSSFAEGFSTAATEALVLGLPVVTTAVSGMEEMLGANNEYGIIVENNENALECEMRKILENSDITAKYRERAKYRGEFFKKEKTVSMVENYFDSLMCSENMRVM